MGDSFTEGAGLEFRKTFVGKFKKYANEKNIDVLNAAVSSYSPIIYLRKLKYLIESVQLKVDEVFVFLDISDIEDETVYQADPKGNIVSVHKSPWHTIERHQWGNLGYFLRQNLSISARVHRVFYRRLYPERFKPNPYGKLRGRWTYDPSAWKTYGEEGLRKATEHMEALLEFLNTKGVKMRLAVYPWPNQIVEDVPYSLQATYWSAWSKRFGVDLLNLFPVFMRFDEKEIEKHFLAGDFHWSEEGHHVVFEHLVKLYEDTNLLSSVR